MTVYVSQFEREDLLSWQGLKDLTLDELCCDEYNNETLFPKQEIEEPGYDFSWKDFI